LGIENGRLTGEVIGEIVDRAGKATALRTFASSLGIPLEETIAIGDGANDIDMVRLAGLGVAFRGKPALAQVADLKIDRTLVEVIPYLQS
jgi:phosphoserine phosphatase